MTKPPTFFEPDESREVEEDAKNKTHSGCAVNLCGPRKYLITVVPFPILIIVIQFL